MIKASDSVAMLVAAAKTHNLPVSWFKDQIKLILREVSQTNEEQVKILCELQIELLCPRKGLEPP